MARKRRGRKMPGWKKALKTIAGVGTGIIIAGPIVIPAIAAAKTAASGDFAGAGDVFVYEASGYSIAMNKVDNAKLQQVATRDAIMVAVGLGLRWALKRV